MFLPLTSRLSAHDRGLVEVSIIETERTRWQHSCGRKYRHRDYGAASAEAERMTRETGIPYEVYVCDFDGSHYHIGRRSGD